MHWDAFICVFDLVISVYDVLYYIHIHTCLIHYMCCWCISTRFVYICICFWCIVWLEPKRGLQAWTIHGNHINSSSNHTHLDHTPLRASWHPQAPTPARPTKLDPLKPQTMLWQKQARQSTLMHAQTCTWMGWGIRFAWCVYVCM